MVGAELMRDPPERCWRIQAWVGVPSLRARPMIWDMHIHEGPKRDQTASCEHIVCMENGPPEHKESGAAGQRTLHSFVGFNTGLLSLTASRLHPVLVPAQFADPFPSKQNDGLLNVWNRIHSAVVARMKNANPINKPKRKCFLLFTR